MGFKLNIDASALIGDIIGNFMKKGATNVATEVSKMVINKGANEAISWVSKKLGVPPEQLNEAKTYEERNTVKKLTVLDAEIEKYKKEVRIAEIEQQKRDKELDYLTFKEENIDIQDSRKQDVFQRVTGTNFFERNVTHIFAFISLFMASWLLWALITNSLKMPHDMATELRVFASGLIMLVAYHYFGHTKSSGDKTNIIAKMEEERFKKDESRKMF